MEKLRVVNFAHENTQDLIKGKGCAPHESRADYRENVLASYGLSRASLQSLIKRENRLAIFEQVTSITILALISKSLLHINVNYKANLEEVEVKVFDANTTYDTAHSRKFSYVVYLDNPHALNQLKALEDKLIDLVVEAKGDE